MQKRMHAEINALVNQYETNLQSSEHTSRQASSRYGYECVNVAIYTTEQTVLFIDSVIFVENAPPPNSLSIREYVLVCVCMTITDGKRMDEPRKVANPAHGQLKSYNELSPFSPESLISRDRFSRPVPRQQPCLVLHTLRLNLVRTDGAPSAFHDGVRPFLARVYIRQGGDGDILANQALSLAKK